MIGGAASLLRPQPPPIDSTCISKDFPPSPNRPEATSRFLFRPVEISSRLEAKSSPWILDARALLICPSSILLTTYCSQTPSNIQLHTKSPHSFILDSPYSWPPSFYHHLNLRLPPLFLPRSPPGSPSMARHSRSCI